MSKEGKFLTYCVELYKNAKDLTGRQVVDLFDQYDLWGYIMNYFEALHTTGPGYIINDIDEFIEARQPT